MGENLIQVEGRRDLRRFVQAPRHLYRGDPWFVPPLAGEEMKILDRRRNPFFRHARSGFWLLLRAGRAAGRISATRDANHDACQDSRVGFFGHFEAADRGAANRLLERAREWLRAEGAQAMRGPVSLSTNHRCGLLVEGFEGVPVVEMPYNPPVYEEWIRDFGLAPVKDLLSFILDRENHHMGRLDRLVERAQDRGGFTSRSLDMKRFPAELDLFRRIYNEAWSRNWGFVPLEEEEFRFQAGSLKMLVDPRLCHIVEKEGDPAGFILMIPDINLPLRKCGGRLFPFGFFRVISFLRNPTQGRVLLMGVREEYRGRGVESILISQVFRQARDQGYDRADLSWILEDNRALIGPLEKLGALPWRRFRLFEQPLRP